MFDIVHQRRLRWFLHGKWKDEDYRVWKHDSIRGQKAVEQKDEQLDSAYLLRKKS
jgi:hypothetical protein